MYTNVQLTEEHVHPTFERGTIIGKRESEKEEKREKLPNQRRRESDNVTVMTCIAWACMQVKMTLY